jgi:hypothetical protein
LSLAQNRASQADLRSALNRNFARLGSEALQMKTGPNPRQSSVA